MNEVNEVVDDSGCEHNSSPTANGSGNVGQDGESSDTEASDSGCRGDVTFELRVGSTVTPSRHGQAMFNELPRDVPCRRP